MRRVWRVSSTMICELGQPNETELSCPHAGTRFAYDPQGNGKWMSLNLKKRKKLAGKRRVKKIENGPVIQEDDVEHGDVDMDVSNFRLRFLSIGLALIGDGRCT